MKKSKKNHHTELCIYVQCLRAFAFCSVNANTFAQFSFETCNCTNLTTGLSCHISHKN